MSSGMAVVVFVVAVVVFAGLAFLASYPPSFWRAKKQLPLYDRFGLSFMPSGSLIAIGKLQGSVDGFKIKVEPDERTKIKIELPSSPDVVISLESLGNQVREPFSFGNPALDNMLRNKGHSDGAAERLVRDPDAQAALAGFLGKWRGRIRTFLIVSGRLECSPARGTSQKVNFILPQQLDELLPDLLELAKAIENAYANAGANPAHQ